MIRVYQCHTNLPASSYLMATLQDFSTATMQVCSRTLTRLQAMWLLALNKSNAEEWDDHLSAVNCGDDLIAVDHRTFFEQNQSTEMRRLSQCHLLAAM